MSVISRLDVRHRALTKNQLHAIMPRSGVTIDSVMESVSATVNEVRARGAQAVLDHARQFDGVDNSVIKVPQQAIDDALARLDPQLKTSLEVAIERVRAVHADQLRQSVVTELADGARVEQRYVPLDRVGVYVPGGKAVYPSSVIMNVVPAQIAGVSRIVVASPGQRDHAGLPHPTVLAVAGLLGVTEVWTAGGAAAVGLLAFGAGDSDGTELESVDLISGPGNIYVTAAKALVHGLVGIDSEAGPSEIAIIADESANVDFIAADMVSQAEHDPLAAAVLICTDEATADRVEAALEAQALQAKHQERILTALGGPQSSIIVVDSIDQAVRVANAYAAEHLEIHTRDAYAVSQRITNAGAIFCGPFSPVPLGDYAAGSNHVLPTSGRARYQSGLSVLTFTKLVNVINYTAQGLRAIGDDVIALATAEDLPAHGTSIALRMDAHD